MYIYIMITGDLNIVVVSNDKEYAQAMKVRRDVFVDEYKIPADKEFDGNDFCATHILALDNDKPVGTMRIRYFNGFVKMERMCVVKNYRKTNVSEQIMQKGMLFAAQKGYEKAYGVCKAELLNRWKQNGFEPIMGADTVEQNGMKLIPVCCRLPEVENVITMHSDANILNAKEGNWFNNEQDDAVSRINRLTQKVRKIKHSDETSDKMWHAPLIYPILYKTDNKTH